MTTDIKTLRELLAQARTKSAEGDALIQQMIEAPTNTDLELAILQAYSSMPELAESAAVELEKMKALIRNLQTILEER